MYFGGVGQREQQGAGGTAIYTVGAGVFDECLRFGHRTPSRKLACAAPATRR